MIEHLQVTVLGGECVTMVMEVGMTSWLEGEDNYLPSFVP